MQETVQQSAYKVKTPSFEGPLEILLSLVESRKLFINEISLGKVTDEFLSYTRSLPKSELSELTSFLSIAATLILIKSRSLLPGFLVTKEEEQDIKDLESRLSLYAMIKEISMQIGPQYGVRIMRLPPERELFTSVFAPDPKLTVPVLLRAVQESLNRVPKEEVLPQVRVRKVLSIDEMLTSLTERIATAARMSFKEWQKTLPNEDVETVKRNVIVSFLAMLELVRQGMMDALQNEDFEDIELIKADEAIN